MACNQPLHAISPVVQSSLGNIIRGPLPQGHLLQQRYSIVAQVGTGGFGAVYKAEDTLFSNRHVAIKEVNQDGLSAQELAEATVAIQHEVLLLAGLNHPNLPRIHSQFVESGRPGSNGGGMWRAGLGRRFSVAPSIHIVMSR